MEKNNRIVILGSGNVGEALVRAFTKVSGITIRQVFARNRKRGKALAAIAGCAWEHRPEKLAQADIYILAVSDKAIGERSATLDFGKGLVVHTCGSCSPEELSDRIKRRGVFYPLQTFTVGRAVDFQNIPLFIEAEQEADYPILEALAGKLSESVYRSDAELRRKMHIAAVFVCNFVNDLYAVGEQWMTLNGMNFEVLKPLIAETTRKMLESGSPLAVQTGPAVREDRPTIEKHLQLLQDYPDLETIYRVLTGHILKMKQTDGKF